MILVDRQRFASMDPGLRRDDVLTDAGLNIVVSAQAGTHDRITMALAKGSSAMNPGLRRDVGLTDGGRNIIVPA